MTKEKENNDNCKTIDQLQFRITVATSITIIIFLLVASYQVATWKAEISNKCIELDGKIDSVNEKIQDKHIEVDNKFEDTYVKIKELEIKGTAQDIELAKINTKLANIETILIEIKSDMKTT